MVLITRENLTLGSRLLDGENRSADGVLSVANDPLLTEMLLVVGDL